VNSTGLLAASLRAGTETYKHVAPPPRPPLYGVGIYGAIDGGANVYQNRVGDRTFTQHNPNDTVVTLPWPAEASRLAVVPRLRDEGWLAKEATIYDFLARRSLGGGGNASIDMARKSY
jgi:hypothetical protein